MENNMEIPFCLNHLEEVRFTVLLLSQLLLDPVWLTKLGSKLASILVLAFGSGLRKENLNTKTIPQIWSSMQKLYNNSLEVSEDIEF